MSVEAVKDKIEALFAAVDNGQKIHDIMRSNERARGYKIVVPDEVSWLPSEDWDSSVVVSIVDNPPYGSRVRLVAILAKHPCNGAFRRLIAGIKDAGFIPTIIGPTIEMRETLRRWGWRGKHHGFGFESEEIWRPRKNGY